MHLQNSVLASLLHIAADAAQEIMAVYERPFEVDFKTPEDPVTEADRRANALITARLANEYSSIPVVAEETPAHLWGSRQNAERIFFVDPVDGTREFVERNDQFSIMIGLVEDAHPSVGVVWAPALKKVWAASPEDGAFQLGLSAEFSSAHSILDLSKIQPIHVSHSNDLWRSKFMLSPRFNPKKSGALAARLQPEQQI